MADQDPLDAGRWLIPAHATSEEPPTPGEGQFVAWNGSAWEVRDIPPTPPQPEPEPLPPPQPEPVATHETEKTTVENTEERAEGGSASDTP